MADIFDREVYKSIFGEYPDGNYELLDAVPGEDGVYRVPGLEENPEVQWKYMSRYWGLDRGLGDNAVFYITGT